MIQQWNCKLPLLRAAQLSQRTVRVMAEASSRGPNVRSMHGSPLCIVIGIFGMGLPGVECCRIFAVMVYRCVAGRLPLLLMYPLGGGGSPCGGGGKCVRLLGGIPLMVGAGRAVAAMEVPGAIGSWCL